MKTMWMAFKKFSFSEISRNPIMFITYLTAIYGTLVVVTNTVNGKFSWYDFFICFFIWLTAYFGLLAEAVAEGRGKAQAESLRKAREQLMANYLDGNQIKVVPATSLKKGDLVECHPGDLVPCDGEITEGMASIDESAITGESAPVIREAGGDFSSVTAGTRVLSDYIKVRVSVEKGESFLDRMISLIEGASRQKTPNEMALNIVLASLTLIFLVVILTIRPYFQFVNIDKNLNLNVLDLLALFICLIPTTIGGLISAIGISGMDRLLKKNIVAKSGKAVEVAGDVSVLLLDKTGTITYGHRMASQFFEAPGVRQSDLTDAAIYCSYFDDTPEGKSIYQLVRKFHREVIEIEKIEVEQIPFSAQTRMSGVNFTAEEKHYCFRKGAVDAIKRYVESNGGEVPSEVIKYTDTISKLGGTPLLISTNLKILGAVYLKDTIKDGIKEKFQQLREMKIKTIMITGDNPLTAAAIALEAGVDDFMAEATPEMKMKKIKEEQMKGNMVAMTGDGTNDAPALAMSDVGVAMNSGTQAAKEASNMVDLDSDPSKLIEVVRVGKQLLITRGALTTFSFANDVAKYFAIIPALFGGLYALSGHAGPLSALNIMRLHSSQSAIMSSIIFNALIVVALIPLTLRGVEIKALSPSKLLTKNIFIYGLGGVLTPFIGIKLIDLIVGKIIG